MSTITFHRVKFVFAVFASLSATLLPAQQIIDSCFTSISVGTTFASSTNISNRNADCINWTGSTWVGDWPGANLTLAPPGSVPNTRAIWMGDGTVWTTGGEGFGLRLNAPLLNGVTYNFEFTRVSHGTGSAGNFAPILYTNTGGILGTMVGVTPGVGSSWTTGIISLTAGAANNGHTFIYFNAQNGSTGSGMFLACGNAVILPMELRRLDGWGEKEGNRLFWEMYNEAGYLTHFIERSADGETFREAGSLASSGSEDLTAYSYRDSDPAALNSASVFYRIRSLLADGAEAISPVLEIRRDRTADYFHKTWPNPLAPGQSLHLAYVSGESRTAQLSLTDALGRLVATRPAELNAGLNELEWSLPPLEAGIYLLQLKTRTGAVHARIVVK